ncbi:hypothetical protein H109_07778 [Trichophyton interdigitale MR816]|uniref:Uncharacterized protein n=1 Tax=Trichophyton interdigitale (strain MR816) TaxID=1215338 RepID=A0A059IXM9_TRIIM|nr:hypothetical protein H109_07778 [Trichophyton interdigitale MR816]
MGGRVRQPLSRKQRQQSLSLAGGRRQALQRAALQFDIRGCDGQTHHGYEQRAISSDEFRVSTSTMRIAFRDAEDDQTEDDQTLTVGSKTGIGIGVGLAVITFVSTVDGDEDERSTPEMPTDNETVKQSVFEVEGQEQQQKLGELQGSLAASEMPASSAHQQPAAPVELPGSIPRTT